MVMCHGDVSELVVYWSVCARPTEPQEHAYLECRYKTLGVKIGVWSMYVMTSDDVDRHVRVYARCYKALENTPQSVYTGSSTKARRQRFGLMLRY